MNPNDQLGLILALLSMREQMPSTSDPQPMPQDPYTDWSIEFPTDKSSWADRKLAMYQAASSGLHNHVGKVDDPRANWMSEGERYRRGGWGVAPKDAWDNAHVLAMLERLAPLMSVARSPEKRKGSLDR